MLEELGLPYTNVPIDFRSEEIRSTHYLALNPDGRVPTLVDGEVEMWESIAINLYLARTYDRGTMPRSAAGEAGALTWSFWAVSELDAPHDVALRERSTISQEQLSRGFDILNRALVGRSFLAEDRFTVTDLNGSSITLRPSYPTVSLDRFPELVRWREACFARPAFRRTVEVLSAAQQAVAADVLTPVR
jgi:glutathione S-transferase